MSARQPPRSSTILRSLPIVHYVDAFSQQLPARPLAAAVAQALFQRAPGWVRALLWLRNAATKPLGLHPAAGADPENAPSGTGPLRAGTRLALFQVFSVTPTEVLLGLNDQHLDFRVAVVVEPTGREGARVWLCTAVQFHNRLGRAYFTLIRPFHALIVRVLLRAGQRRLTALTAPV